MGTVTAAASVPRSFTSTNVLWITSVNANPGSDDTREKCLGVNAVARPIARGASP